MMIKLGVSLILFICPLASGMELPEVPNELELELEKCVAAGNLDKTKELLTKEPNLHALYGAEKESILIRSINEHEDSPEIVKLLLAQGVSANLPDTGGTTPLLKSLLISRSDIALILLDNNADIKPSIKLYNGIPVNALEIAKTFKFVNIKNRIEQIQNAQPSA
jgi:ankyrin repeat protein